MKTGLTKIQVQEIESRLETNGLQYWDIRIEILDHLVSEIEAKMEKGEPYESAKENAFFKLKLNGNLEGLHKSRMQKINNIVKRQYFRKVRTLVSQPKSLLIVLSAVLAYFYVFYYASSFLFNSLTVILLFTPILYGVFLYFKNFLKNQKSGYLIYSSFYIFFSFLLLNGFLQFFKPDGIFTVTKETQRLIWFVVTSINTVFSYAGIAIYLQTRKKILGIENAIKM